MGFWTVTLVIIFTTALVLGPIMWVKPSGRDGRLAKFRQRAAQTGLSVQMQPLPEALGEGSAAVYFARWQNPRRLQTGWGLELKRMRHEMYFAGRWDWYHDHPAPRAAHDSLRKLLQQLPKDATAIVCSDIGLGIQWHESSGDEGFGILQKALLAFSQTIEEAIRQPQNHRDSVHKD